MSGSTIPDEHVEAQSLVMEVMEKDNPSHSAWVRAVGTLMREKWAKEDLRRLLTALVKVGELEKYIKSLEEDVRILEGELEELRDEQKENFNND